MRIYYDTEFLERGPDYPVELISMALVADDGRELYVINGEAPLAAIASHPWLMQNVVPSLPMYVPEDPNVRKFVDGLMWDDANPVYDENVFNRMVIREKLTEFIDATPAPELWGYCAAYDHVLLAQCFGTMVGMHKKLRFYTNDLAQEMRRLKVRHEKLPEQTGTLHNALDDARWTRDAVRWLDEYANQAN